MGSTSNSFVRSPAPAARRRSFSPAPWTIRRISMPRSGLPRQCCRSCVQRLPQLQLRRRRTTAVAGRTGPCARAQIFRSPGKWPDIRPYLADALAMVVPLRSGGGTRLKILQAMAMARPVVSTTLGAEGLRVADNEHRSDRRLARPVRRTLSSPWQALHTSPGVWQKRGGSSRWRSTTGGKVCTDWRICIRPCWPAIRRDSPSLLRSLSASPLDQDQAAQRQKAQHAEAIADAFLPQRCQLQLNIVAAGRRVDRHESGEVCLATRGSRRRLRALRARQPGK